MVRALIQHTVHIQPQSTSEATPIPVDQVLALVDWYENHPERNHFGDNIIVTSTISHQLTAASFIPVSRNIARCAFLETIYIQFSLWRRSYHDLCSFVKVFLSIRVFILFCNLE